MCVCVMRLLLFFSFQVDSAGFTGHETLLWKLSFYNLFNRLEYFFLGRSRRKGKRKREKILEKRLRVTMWVWKKINSSSQKQTKKALQEKDLIVVCWKETTKIKRKKIFLEKSRWKFTKSLKFDISDRVSLILSFYKTKRKINYKIVLWKKTTLWKICLFLLMAINNNKQNNNEEKRG